VKNKQRLRELAEQHGVKLKKRVFFDTRDDSGRKQTTFMDIDKPAAEIADELKELGVMQ
jgi:hypothetical protein